MQNVIKKIYTFVSDNTTRAEDIGDFSKSLRNNRFIVSQKLAKNALKNPLEIGPNVGSAVESRKLRLLHQHYQIMQTFIILVIE